MALIKEDIFKILTELESLDCYEISTKQSDRRRIVDEIIVTIQKGTNEELLDKMSGRWL